MYRELEDALPGHAIATVLPHGQLDRRRPRRQSRSSPPTRCAWRWRARRDGAALLPDRSARARRRAVDLGHARAGDARDARRWPSARPTSSAHREDEPYRRALIGMYARLAATLHELHRHRGAAPRGRAAEPVRARRRVAAPTCASIEASLRRAPRAGADRAAPGAADARGAGVRLSPRDGRPAPELRQARGGGRRAAAASRASSPTTPRCPKPRAATLLLRLLDDARPLRVRAADYSELRRQRARDLRGRAARCCSATAATRCATTSSRTPRT